MREAATEITLILRDNHGFEVFSVLLANPFLLWIRRTYYQQITRHLFIFILLLQITIIIISNTNRTIGKEVVLFISLIPDL